MNNISKFYMGNGGLALRLVVGWTYFSAFWRRLILENKLDPDAAGYVGEKFNHFLPNALFIKPLIEYLVTHPEALLLKMWVFTIVEGIVGLLLILGYRTRLMSFIVIFLALGILLGSGWLGTTCLDEWQIGILGIAGGFTLLQLGSGKISLDALSSQFEVREAKWMKALQHQFYKPFVIISFAILGLSLYTNQVFHGGVFGTLHNKSVKPKLEITNTVQNGKNTSFDVMRVEGADVYGSFLIGIDFYNKNGQKIYSLGMEELRNFPKENISNYYVSKIVPHKNSLLLPLGAKAKLNFEIQEQVHEMVLTDISGLQWKANFKN